MDRTTKQEWKQKYALALSQNLEKGNWEKVQELLPAAENIGVSSRQLQKTWTNFGIHQKNQNNLVSAVVSFASARRHALDNNQILAELLLCLGGFIERFESKFSREDLVHLEYGLDRVYSFQKTRPKTSDANLQRAKELLAYIRAQKQVAPSKQETPATHHVLRIFAALHPDMTFDEVKVEFARVVAPLIRRKLAESKKPTAKKPSSTGGKKPPKNKDDKDK